MKVFKNIILWLWQFPQNIIGFIISRFSKSHPVVLFNDKEVLKIYWMGNFFRSAVSLGNYICASNIYQNSIDKFLMFNHEHGHQKQSRYLGIFYLLVIGLPSLIGNMIDRIFHKNWDFEKREKWYYSQPWERWADHLGNVDR